MSEHFFLFDGAPGDDREYGQAYLAFAFEHTATSGGISRHKYDNPLSISVLPTGDILLAPGIMQIKGFFYHLDDDLILSPPLYLQGTPRTDRVIVRLNISVDTRNIRAQIVVGTNGATAPALVRTGNIYDMGIAILRFNGSTLTVEDTRADRALCGFIGDELAKTEDLDTIQTELQTEILTVGAEAQNAISALDNRTAAGFETADANIRALGTDIATVERDLTTSIGTVRTDLGTRIDNLTDHFTATLLPNAAWLGSTAPYTQVVSVPGLLVSDAPIVDVVVSSTLTTAQDELKAWANVYRVVAGANALTVYASKRATVALNVQIKVVR